MAKKLALPTNLLNEINSGDNKAWNAAHGLRNGRKSRKDARKEQRALKKSHKGNHNQNRPAAEPSPAKSATPTPKSSAKRPRDEAKISLSGTDSESELDNSMSIEQTMAALKAAKSGMNPKNSSEKPQKKKVRFGENDIRPIEKLAKNKHSIDEPASRFVSQSDLELMRKDEDDARYFAKQLGMKSLKLKSGDDFLDNILGDLDVDHYGTDEEVAGDSETESSSESESESESDAEVVKSKPDRNTRFIPEHEKELMRKDEAEARRFAKLLGQKSLKLKPSDDGLDELLGDLDFDSFDDLDRKLGQEDKKGEDELTDSSSSGSGSEEEVIENPWSDDSLSESDFTDNTDLEDNKDEPEPGADDEPALPWSSDDSLSESDFTDNTDLEEASKTAPSTQGKKAGSSSPGNGSEAEDDEEIIENPWSDDSLSSDDFTEDSDLDAPAKTQHSHSSDSSSDSSSDGSLDPDLDDAMSVEQTMKALANAKKRFSQQTVNAVEKPALDDDGDEAGSSDFDSDIEGEFDGPELSVDETMAALMAAKQGKKPTAATASATESSRTVSKAGKVDPFKPATAAKYVPPSRRKLEQLHGQSESADFIKLKRMVNGSINKLAENNVMAILQELLPHFNTFSRNTTTDAIIKVCMESALSQSQPQQSTLVVLATLLTALYRTNGVDFGAQLLQSMVEEFNRLYQLDPKTEGLASLLGLILECYNVKLVSCTLVYDLIKKLLDDISDTSAELLLLVVRNCGQQLRSDDPSSLKDIVVQLQKAVSQSEQAKASTKLKFLVENIISLKNNRQKSFDEVLPGLRIRMKKFLGPITGAGGEPIRVSLDDICQIETKGKWWLVGAAWQNVAGTPQKRDDADVLPEVDDILSSADVNWVELAKKQRLNTDIRRAIFVALMGAEDYMDAFQRIEKLSLKSKQERDIPFVILHCCLNEQVYNPYYALVASKFASQRHTTRKSFQFLLWSYLSSLETPEAGANTSVRRTMHYARFYAALVAQGVMSLDVLKTLDMLSAGEDARLFLEMFLVRLLDAVSRQTGQAGKRRDPRNLQQMLTKTSTKSVLRGLQFYLRQLGESEVLELEPKLRSGVKWAIPALQTLLSEMDLGNAEDDEVDSD